MWQQWVNTVLGLWIIAISFIGITGSTLTWTLVVTGIVIAVISLWGIQGTSSESERMMRHT